MAKSEALSNAAEMIRSHGEEGFAFDDQKLNDEYQRQTQKLYEQLQSRADNFAMKYHNLGVAVDNSIDPISLG